MPVKYLHARIGLSRYRDSVPPFKITIMMFVFAFLLLGGRAHSASVTVAWESGDAESIAGHVIHYGFSSGDYSDRIDVGMTESTTIDGLTAGQTVFISATSYDRDGNESAFSEEIEYTPMSETNDAACVVCAGFDTGLDGFVYEDDLFYATNAPAYADGRRLDFGGISGGTLQLNLGGINTTDIYGMSGGWRLTFTLDQPTEIDVSFFYYMTLSSEYEKDEVGQVLIKVDDTFYGEGTEKYVTELAGDGDGGAIMTTGWRSFRASLGMMAAGTHELVIGGYNSKKTASNEVTEILFDNVHIVGNLPAGDDTAPSVPDTDPDVDQNTDPDTGGVTDLPDSSDSSAGDDASDTGTSADAAQQTDFISADFDSDANGFVYRDDSFRATSAPDYASGRQIASGGISGGALHVELGGIDGVDITKGMSGGWRRTFTLDGPGTASVSFLYNMTQSPNYESDEISQVLVSLDGVLYGSDGNDFVDRLAGDGEGGDPKTTGWQSFTIDLGWLDAGDHELVIGVFNNKKTASNETTEILIDDVLIEWTVPDAATESVETPASDPVTDDSDTGTTPQPTDPVEPDANSDPILDNSSVGADEEPVEPPSASASETVSINADFDSHAAGFAYRDDTFRSTNEPDYADGRWIGSGGFSGGALAISLGGIDHDDIEGMSGGWAYRFTLSEPADTRISFAYRMTQAWGYEKDEPSQMLVSVDGKLYGEGTNDYIEEITGDGDIGDAITTDWQTFTVNLGWMPAGGHDLIIGGYNKKKTVDNEFTEILIDNVKIEWTKNVAAMINSSMVSIEAEAYFASLSQGEHEWLENYFSGGSGDMAMEVLPNIGTLWNQDYIDNSPSLDYTAMFVQAGTYYVWVRGIGASKSDDSVHVGLNGERVPSCERIGGFTSSWTWSNKTMDGIRATMTIPAGTHSVNVWMREDGFILDKLILTNDPDFVPDGVMP